MISPLDSMRTQHAPDGCCQAPPLAGFAMQLLAAGLGQSIEPRLAVVFAGAPFGFDPAAGFQALQRRIKRAVVN
jgi:hypothetical protein